MFKEMKSYEISACAALAAISAAVQIVHIGYPTQWGMWIDIVAIPWILAFFLFRGKGAFIVSLIVVSKGIINSFFLYNIQFYIES